MVSRREPFRREKSKRGHKSWVRQTIHSSIFVAEKWSICSIDCRLSAKSLSIRWKLWWNRRQSPTKRSDLRFQPYFRPMRTLMFDNILLDYDLFGSQSENRPQLLRSFLYELSFDRSFHLFFYLLIILIIFVLFLIIICFLSLCFY